MTLCRNFFGHNSMSDNVTIHTSNTKKASRFKHRFDPHLNRPGRRVSRGNSSIPEPKENDTDVIEYDSFIGKLIILLQPFKLL